MELPTAVEGSWQLHDKDGKVIASSREHAGASLHVEPYFYRGSYSQTIARIIVAGKRGRKSNVSLKVGGATGQVKAESVDKAQRQVEPGFDKLQSAAAAAPPKGVEGK